MRKKYLCSNLYILIVSILIIIPQCECGRYRGGGGGRSSSRGSSRGSNRPSYGLSPSHPSPSPSSSWVARPAPSRPSPSYPSHPSHPSPSHPASPAGWAVPKSPSHPSPSQPSPSHPASPAGWAVPKSPSSNPSSHPSPSQHSPSHPASPAGWAVPKSPSSHPSNSPSSHPSNSPSSSHPSTSNNAPGIGWKNPSQSETKVDAKHVGSSQSHKPSAPPPENTGWNPGVNKVTANNPPKSTDHINKQTATGTQNAPGIGWVVPKPGSAKPSYPSTSLSKNPSSSSSHLSSPSLSHGNTGKPTQGVKKVDAKNVGNNYKPSASPPEVKGWNPTVNKVTSNNPTKQPELNANKQTVSGSQNVPGQYPYHPPAYPQQPGGYPGYPSVAGGGHYPSYPGGHHPGYPGGQYPGYPGGHYPSYPGGHYPGYPGGHYPGHGGTTIINQNINYNNYHRPNYNPPPVYFPSYSYSSRDFGSGTLGFFLGYSLARLTTPSYHYYGHSSNYDPYRPTYDHYTVHHYYHNKDTVVKQTEVQPNAIVACVGDTGTVCPPGTYALCTNSGSIMCVASASSVQPCANDQQVNCVKSTVPCVNSTTPECKGKTENETATVTIPCIYDTKVVGKIQYVNNTIVLDQPPPPPPPPPVNATANSTYPITTLPPMYQNMSYSQYPVTTQDPITTTPEGEPERSKRDVAQPQQQFCVTIVAEPAVRKQLSEGEQLFKNAKSIFQQFAVKTLGVN